MRLQYFLLGLLLLLLSFSACAMTQPRSQTVAPSQGDYIATIKTNKGSFQFLLFEREAPTIGQNFIELAQKGYYDGQIFHRVIPDFMIQGGDPTGTGRGGQSYRGGQLPDEFIAGFTHLKGTVSMANAGPNSNGSQFFIVTNANGTSYLDGKHSIFGQIFSGQEVVDAISKVPTNAGDRPLEDVIMEKVTVSRF